MESGSSLKDALFNRERVQYLAGLFLAVDATFDTKGFVKEVVEKFPELELKARIAWMAEVAERYLPASPGNAMKLVVKALPAPLNPNLFDDDFGQFILAPLGEYVVRNALSVKYLEQALMTLREITMRFSMEDAMRSFLNAFPEDTLAACDIWVEDTNYHVRRLVSESTRPLLPWSKRLLLDHHVPLKYLDNLYADPTRYVTRSVANHLNDISKKDPDLVVQTLARWREEGRQDSKEMAWIERHSLRTIIKRGHRGALSSLGYLDNNEIRVIDFSINLPSGVLTSGESLLMRVEIISKTDCLVMLDYGIDFMKASGTQKLKMFKWKKCALRAKVPLVLTKKHLFKVDATTFKTYAGAHYVSLQVNGMKEGSLPFNLR